MKIYFAWAQHDEPFSEKHLREDLPILSLSLQQKEGGVAIARLTVGDCHRYDLKGPYAYIAYGDRPIFYGRLLPLSLPLPVHTQEDVSVLELTAEPLSAEQQLRVLLQNHKESPLWDPLFVDPADQDNPVEILENQASLFLWDRVTGKVSLSHIHKGREEMDITSVFLRSSLKITALKSPLKRVTVELKAQWIQCGGGEVDLFPRIAKAFPSGIVNTLTGQSLKEVWPRIGMLFNHQRTYSSDYRVVESRLTWIDPPKTGGLNLYPSQTPPLVLGSNGKSKKLKHHWMRGKLVIAYQIQQKREEVVHFTLINPQAPEGGDKHLRLTLQDVREPQGFDPALGSFFHTLRGRQAVAHAVDMAATHLAARARCLMISVEVPWESGVDITLDHSIKIEDPRLPGGMVQGKVISYELFREGSQAIARLRLGVTPEDLSLNPMEGGSERAYAETGYGDINTTIWHQTPNGRAFADYSDQRAPGMPHANQITLRALLTDVHVQGDGFEQTRHLTEHQYPLSLDPKQALTQCPTTITLRLAPLRTSETLSHRMKIIVK